MNIGSKCLVIGSGPSGVSVASALLERGFTVLLLDGGMDLEAEIQSKVASMSQSEPSKWSSETLDSVRKVGRPDSSGVPEKTVYGSDYVFRGVDSILSLERENTEFKSTLSRGGLSAIWGAAILPYRQEDIEGWPITSSELFSHYRSVLNLLNASLPSDNLSKLFPQFENSTRSLPASGQAQQLLRKWNKSNESLNEAGLWGGQSRLAVKEENGNCKECGLCLSGCPYNLIFNSRVVINRLSQEFKTFSYHPGEIAKSFCENPNKIILKSENIMTGKPNEWEGSHLFLACGPLGTIKLVCDSIGSAQESFELLDSQYFLMPAFSRVPPENSPRKERLHTLSQLFLEILDDSRQSIDAHLQIYTFNEAYVDLLRRKMGDWLYSLFEKHLDFLWRRLLVVQGYIPSQHSGKLVVTYQRKGEDSIVKVRGVENPNSRRHISLVLGKAAKASQLLGIRLYSIFARLGGVGRGFHVGGSFPMRKDPKDWCTDIWGRPKNLSRLSIVDSSVLPSVPANTITLTVMANAHRIGHGVEVIP